jgi:hypothetical protein
MFYEVQESDNGVDGGTLWQETDGECDAVYD